MALQNWADIKNFLDEKVVQYNRPGFVHSDPIQVPHQFHDKKDIEISAFLVSTIAWGQRPVIIKNMHKLVSLMDGAPYQFVAGHRNKDLERLKHFKHRTFNGDDCIFFIRSLKNIYEKYNGLGCLFQDIYTDMKDVAGTIMRFREVFFETVHLQRSQKHISDISKGAPAKRINMFLRWMVRKDRSGVDFGIWDKIPMGSLYLPLDVHTGNVARKLGLLKRTQDDWKAVLEISSVLRTFDAEDPVKYDFALFGLGAFEKF